MKREIVVARYLENKKWFEKYPEARVYTKNVDIPNFGRESSTYLHHIIENYDNLADFTIFCQADPFDHIASFEDLIKDYEHDYKEYGGWFVSSKGDGTPQHAGLRVDDASMKFFGRTLPEYGFVSGAQFVVSKERIRSRSKEFYESLLQYCKDDTDAPWVLERLWRLVFGQV
jgi:hypothetical protein